jgi:hypothetical protein
MIFGSNIAVGKAEHFSGNTCVNCGIFKEVETRERFEISQTFWNNNPWLP